MTPWFIAIQPFSPRDGEGWHKYVAWSGLTQLKELVSLDCPRLLKGVREEYWPHIVQEDFQLHFFLDFDFLMAQVANIEEKNILCVFRNPTRQPQAPSFANFHFLGYDLVERETSVSALTNCGGFPDVFDNSELSDVGLMPTLDRAVQVQETLRTTYPGDPHANCDVWAIFRLAG